jgi:hypothetical protein
MGKKGQQGQGGGKRSAGEEGESSGQGNKRQER